MCRMRRTKNGLTGGDEPFFVTRALTRRTIVFIMRGRGRGGGEGYRGDRRRRRSPMDIFRMLGGHFSTRRSLLALWV